MAKKQNGSIKHSLITQDNKRIVITTAIASFVVVFSLVASNILFSQLQYQNRVIKERKASLDNIKESYENVKKLQASYDTFNNRDPNYLGGSISGEGDRDGRNSKMALDALPSSYNFPALAASIEKIVEMNGLEFVSVTGNDDAVAQQINETSSSPTPIEIPFEFSVKGGPNATQALLKDLERSIRPFHVTAVTLTAQQQDGSVTIKIAGKTFFQPKKNLNPREEVIQ